MWALVRQGVLIPGMPPVAPGDALPVLRIATRTTRRKIQFQPFWHFPASSRGAAPNWRQAPRMQFNAHDLTAAWAARGAVRDAALYAAPGLRETQP